MRLFTSTLLSILTLPLFAQNQFIEDYFPTKDGRIFYQEVVEVDSSKSPNQIKKSAKKWAAYLFSNYDAALELEGDDFLIFKGYLVKGWTDDRQGAKNWFTLTVECKEGKFRYTLTNITCEYYVHAKWLSLDYVVHYKEAVEDLIQYSDHELPSRKNKYNKYRKEYGDYLHTGFSNMTLSLKKYILASLVEEW